MKLVNDPITCIKTPLEIVTDSFKTRIFQDSWKTKSVIPIPKVNNSNNYDEYRPINMLATFKKNVEDAANSSTF